MDDLNKKLSLLKNDLTEEKTQEDIEYLDTLFNIPAEDYAEVYKNLTIHLIKNKKDNNTS